MSDALPALSNTEKRFLEEYLIDLNGTRAYRVVFPAANYSTARNGACVLLAKPHIKAELESAQADYRERCQVDAVSVITEYARLATADVFDCYDAKGNLRPISKIPLATRRAISAVKVKKGKVTRSASGKTKTKTSETEIEYKFHSKTEALKQLAAHLGINKEIPPLDLILNLLPEPQRGIVRAALAEALRAGASPTSTPGTEDAAP